MHLLTYLLIDKGNAASRLCNRRE